MNFFASQYKLAITYDHLVINNQATVNFNFTLVPFYVCLTSPIICLVDTKTHFFLSLTKNIGLNFDFFGQLALL